MRKILAIVGKDLRLRFTSPSEWLFFLILPVLFTVVLAGGTGETGDARIRLVIADRAGSPLAEQLIAELAESDAVRPDVLPLERAEDEYRTRRVSSLLVIPPEFDLEHVEQGTVDLELRQQPNNINALAAAQAVQAVIWRIGSAVGIANSGVAEAERLRPFASGVERQAYFEEALAAAQAEMAAAPDRLAVVEGATADEVEYDPRANSSAGQLITWVFIPLMGIAGMFAYERQTGTLRRLLVSPASRSTYLLGTIIGQVATALVQMLLLVIFGIVVMRLSWGHSPGALALILLASALAAAALGTMLGAFVKSEGQASGLAWMLGMVMALVGGCWYPAELFPGFVRTAAQVLPTSWAMEGMLNIVLRGQGMAGVLLPAGVLLGMAALFFAVGVWRFRYE